MTYRNFPSFRHDDAERTGAVLVNSGPLDSLAPAGIRRFLQAPLSGPRFVNEYHDHPAYIEALRASVQKVWQRRRSHVCWRRSSICRIRPGA